MEAPKDDQRSLAPCTTDLGKGTRHQLSSCLFAPLPLGRVLHSAILKRLIKGVNILTPRENRDP